MKKMTILFNRLSIKFGGYFVGVVVWVICLLSLFSWNRSESMAVIGSLMITTSMFAGLAFSFSGAIETPADKQTAVYVGEKCFFATLCLALMGMAGFGAFSIDAFSPKSVENWPWIKTLVKGILYFFGLLFWGSSVGAMILGHDAISELFMKRWSRRLTLSSKELGFKQDKLPNSDGRKIAPPGTS